jgi:hypothetical protein
MLVMGKKCWARSVKKWLLKNQSQEVADSLPLVQLSLEIAPQLTMTHALQAKTLQPSLEMAPGTMHIHPTRLVRVKGRVESQMLWCNTHNVQVEIQMAKLATLQLVQSIGVRFMIGSLINQEAGAPPPQGFPHTMLNVKRMKHNMQLDFIEKLFINHEIKTNV